MATQTPTTKIANGKGTHAGTEAAASAAHDLIDRAAKYLEGPEERVRQAALEAQRALKTSVTTAQAKSVQARGATENFVRQHPIAALGLAIGIGALLASRMRSRSE